MAEEIKVGIADYKTSNAPNRIITLGLGSCVGITIYDEQTGIGGLAHIMLPDSTQFQKNIKAGKFADLAIPYMLKELLRRGIRRDKIIAKIAGGASMFNFSEKSLNMDVGNRNIKAVQEVLQDLNISIKAQDVGGNCGRTMILDLGDRAVYIKRVGQEITLL